MAGTGAGSGDSFGRGTQNSSKYSHTPGFPYHRITEWSGLEGTSVSHPVQTPAQAGSPTAGCTGPCPGGS